MEIDQGNAIIHAAKHLKYSVEKVLRQQNQYRLALQYRIAKPNQSIQGNKLFQQILKKSHQHLIIMNPDKQMNRNQYVRLKGLASIQEFNTFKRNLKKFQQGHQIKYKKAQNVSINSKGKKITFQSELMEWRYKRQIMLFKPCYQAVRNQTLFRIALFSQFHAFHQPNKKIKQILQEAINNFIKDKQQENKRSQLLAQQKKKNGQKQIDRNQLKYKKQQLNKQKNAIDTRQDVDAPLRFKTEQKYYLNRNCFIVMSSVYQVANLQLYRTIKDGVLGIKPYSNNEIGKMLLSGMVKNILQKKKDELSYEIELRFNHEFVKQFDELDQEKVYNILNSAAQMFVMLGKNPQQFQVQEFANFLQQVQLN